MKDEIFDMIESGNGEDAIELLEFYSFEQACDALFEDSDPEDGISDKEVENIKRRKEYQKRILKVIAIATAAIASVVAARAVIKKLEAKKLITKEQAAKALKDAERVENNLTEARNSVNVMRAKKAMSPQDGKVFTGLEKDVDKLSKVANNLGAHFDISQKLDTITGADRKSKTPKIELNAWRKGTEMPAEGEFTGERVMDAILEKYNNDEIDAETCIALMERATERYLDEY